jgi:hypothetical protein
MSVVQLQLETKFHMCASHKAAALEALKAACRADPLWMGDCCRYGDLPESVRARTRSAATTPGPERDLGTPKAEDLLAARTLEEAISILNYEATTDAGGDVVGLDLINDQPSPDEIWIDALAPYVTTGSYLRMIADDFEVWQWLFEDGKWYEEGLGCYDSDTGRVRGYDEDEDEDEGDCGVPAADGAPGPFPVLVTPETSGE